MCYQLIRPILFCLPAETAHHFTLKLLHYTQNFWPRLDHKNPIQVMGLTFKNRVGLAAGLDKNAEYVAALSRFGFGFIEVGTVTPRPQMGNPKPRLFRLKKDEALINRMGFNNLGVAQCVKNILQQRQKYSGILGVNIGKNKDTLNERAIDDYLFCLRQVYAIADYVTVNISSPNTPNLRELQKQNELLHLLTELKKEQQVLQQQWNKYVPLVVKIAPDLSKEELSSMAAVFLDCAIDGVIATNTTLQRRELKNLRDAQQVGGLSGKPLFELSTQVVHQLANQLQGRIPIIAVGGIFSAADAQAKLDAGAELVQLYTGLIFQGPGLIRKILLAS